MEWPSIIAILVVLSWVALVLTLIAISTYREERRLRRSAAYVLYKLGKSQYAIVRSEDYLPVHDMIAPESVIRYFYCESAARAIRIIVNARIARADEIFNATEEDI